MEKILILVFGIIIGIILRKHQLLGKYVGKLVFSMLLPAIVIVEFSSVDLSNWHLSLWGSAFVIILFYIGRAFGFDRHKSALLATAEGGTLGFVLYVTIGSEPISTFLLIDMLGNGAILFSFIYWQVAKEYKLKSFALNPLMLAMGIGLVFNFVGLNFLEHKFIVEIETIVVMITTFLICLNVGMGIKFSVSKEIIFSSSFWKIWTIKILGLSLSTVFSWPLAISILFILPPSFLLPIIYQAKEDESDKAYVSNFIAASLPISLILAVILFISQMN